MVPRKLVCFPVKGMQGFGHAEEFCSRVRVSFFPSRVVACAWGFLTFLVRVGSQAPVIPCAAWIGRVVQMIVGSCERGRTDDSNQEKKAKFGRVSLRVSRDGG